MLRYKNQSSPAPATNFLMGLSNGVSFGLAQPISNAIFGYQTANVNSSWYVSGELTSMLTGGALGRPVGVVVGFSGAILVADDVGDIIWRVSPVGATTYETPMTTPTVDSATVATASAGQTVAK